jgi:NAD(P)-dependent dehydrogenase (short-subunit alcohol dehydrogenase family)
VSQAIWHWCQIDILLNNAGVICTKDLLATESEEWDRVFDVNVRGIYLVTREVLPAMLNRERGVIVNMASVAGLVGLPRRAAYCASKGAVIALTRQIAVEYVARGVRCNCICPGTIDTPLLEQALSEGPDRESARNALIDRQPMGHLGTPEDIASAALYLASDESSFVTGTALVIDGGMLAK